MADETTTGESKRPDPPVGLGLRGRKMWTTAWTEWEFDQHEAELLVETCRTLDLLEQLDATVRREGPMTTDGQGTLKAHPAATEARQQRIVLTRLIAALRLPDGDEGEAANLNRPQRRGGGRGVYAVRPAQ